MSERKVRAWAVVDSTGTPVAWNGCYDVVTDAENAIPDVGERVVPVTIQVEDE